MIGFGSTTSGLSFTKRGEMQDYFGRIAAISEKFEPFIKELGCGIKSTKMELLMDPALAYEFGLFSKQVDLDPMDERNLDCIRDSHGVFIMFPDPKGKGLGIVGYPTYPLAYRTMLQRAGDECRTMLNWDTRKSCRALSAKEKMERLSNDFRLYEGRAKVLVRDGVCMVARSEDYVFLDAEELVHELEDMLGNEHPEYEFVGGSASDDFLVAEYYLNEPLMEEKVRGIIAPGSDKPLRSGIRFSTSDVGLSAVCVKAFYEYDKKRFTIGDGLYLPHYGDASVGKFKDMLPRVENIFKDNEDILEEMYLIKVSSVRGVLNKILEKYSGSFPKEQANEVAAETDAGPGTAIDVYIALGDIAERVGKKSGPNKYLALCDLVERLTKLPFGKIDSGEDWEKI